MKKQFTFLQIIVVVAILTTVASLPALARTLNWGYFDALVIGPNRAAPVASISTAGALTVSSLVTAPKLTASNGPITYTSKTKAQILVLDPTVAGEVYVCSDCTATALCVSSGTAVGAWVKGTDRSAVCS